MTFDDLKKKKNYKIRSSVTITEYNTLKGIKEKKKRHYRSKFTDAFLLDCYELISLCWKFRVVHYTKYNKSHKKVTKDIPNLRLPIYKSHPLKRKKKNKIFERSVIIARKVYDNKRIIFSLFENSSRYF